MRKKTLTDLRQIIGVKIVLRFCCTPRAAGGYGSESEAEDAGDSHVTLPQDLPGRGNIKSEKSSVKVTEVGLAKKDFLDGWAKFYTRVQKRCGSTYFD